MSKFPTSITLRKDVQCGETFYAKGTKVKNDNNDFTSLLPFAVQGEIYPEPEAVDSVEVETGNPVSQEAQSEPTTDFDGFTKKEIIAKLEELGVTDFDA